MIQTVQSFDTWLFLILNGDGGAAMDWLMWYASKTWPWIPLFLCMLWAVAKKFKYSYGAIVLIVICATVSIALSDRISVVGFKEVFKRPRPSRETELIPLIHFVQDEKGNNYIGGEFGFVSSHAANCASALAFFLLLMRPVRNRILLSLLTWYAIVAYSRIYLGVHYPGDIIGGLLLGLLCGWIAAKLFFYLSKLLLGRPQTKLT